ncbi:MAG TPA: LysM peptidoglycan-binding domain-containing protein [Candidatus Limnocylindria bacterium]|jgi:LysM repeat protein|nr:LysM peptidoglycan-binding domain-containing protein [Candidatus Limnocylindria bacterium]
MSTTTPNSPLLDTTRSRNKSTLHFAGFIVAAHLAVFLGLLLIGCNKEKGVDPNAATPNAGMDPAVSGSGAGLGSLPGNVDTNFSAGSNSYTGTLSGTNAPGLGLGLATTSAPPANIIQDPPPLPATHLEQSLAPAGATSYKVKSGDIAYKIAKSHGVTLAALKAANPNVDVAKLKVNQEIQIPEAAPVALKPSPTHETTGATGAAEAPATGTTDYVVKGGDSLSKISRRFHVTVKAIRSANHLTSDNIKQGQKLKIPGKSSTAPERLVPPVDNNSPSASPIPSAQPTNPGSR